MDKNSIYQVSTLQALAMGYSRGVICVAELLQHGNIGLGTFENVDGEMILLDGHCYRARENGTVEEAPDSLGVPFACAAIHSPQMYIDLQNIPDINSLKEKLTLMIDEAFSLNSVHIVRVDGFFKRICARSEYGYKSQHVELKDILSVTQKDFVFENTEGSLVCVYYPDYMDGINAAGWHVHFVSADRSKGGHVFDLELISGKVQAMRIHHVEIEIPSEPAFDTYALKEASQDDIKKVEQGNAKE